MKKTLVVILIVTLLSVMAVGCTSAIDAEEGAQTEESSQAPAEAEAVVEYDVLKVGTMPAAMGAPVEYALEQGYFDDEGLNVEIVLFPTGAPINEAIAAEELDLAVSGLATVFSLANGICDFVGDVSTSGGMGIMVREDSPILSEQGNVAAYPDIYGSADTVGGIQILGPLGTSAQFNANKYAGLFGLEASDINMVHMEYGAALQAFLSGEGDAIATVPPFSFDGAAQGLVMAATFEESTGVALNDGIMVRKEVMETRSEEIVKFMKAVYKASSDLQDDALRAEFSMRWFTENGREYDDETLADEIKARRYVTIDDMKVDGYVFGGGMVEVAKFFVTTGQIDEALVPNVASALDVELLKQATGEDIKKYE